MIAYLIFKIPKNRQFMLKHCINFATGAGGNFFQAALDGQTQLHGFSRALLLNQARLDGELNCNDATDAWADPSVTYSEGSHVFGCEHLPDPAP